MSRGYRAYTKTGISISSGPFPAGFAVETRAPFGVMPALSWKARKPTKGIQTWEKIITAAFSMAKRDGLPAVSLGRLADTLHMSKSGIYSRIGSLEALHEAVLVKYVRDFKRCVLYPAIRHPPGIDRLEKVFERWIAYSSFAEDAGCLWMSSLVSMKEGHETTRQVLQTLAVQWQEILQAIISQTIRVGQLSANCDAHALTFEMQALVLATHHKRHFLGVATTKPQALSSFRRILQSYNNAAPLCPACNCHGDSYIDDLLHWWTLVDEFVTQVPKAAVMEELSGPLRNETHIAPMDAIHQ